MLSESFNCSVDVYLDLTAVGQMMIFTYWPGDKDFATVQGWDDKAKYEH